MQVHRRHQDEQWAPGTLRSALSAWCPKSTAGLLVVHPHSTLNHCTAGTPPRSLPPPAGPLAAAPLPPTAAAHAPRTLQPRDDNAPGYEMYYIKICYELGDELL